MEDGARRVLAGGSRCLLAVAGPLVTPMSYWFDGASVWLSAPAGSAKVAALRDDPRCALWLGPTWEPGVVVHGAARVFSLRDPLGLALHAPTVTAAAAALALGNVNPRALRVPPRLLPADSAVLKVAVADAAAVPLPALPPGIAPALPTNVPADVRRALAGQRRVMLALAGERGVALVPAALGAGSVLTVPPGAVLPDGGDAVAVLDHGGRGASGLALEGTLAPGPALRATRVTWWRGAELGSAEVPLAATTAPGAITLPD